MKYSFIPALMLSLILFSCGNNDDTEVLTAFNAEAFAYDIGGGNWEVNASSRVKGFNQQETEGKYSVHLTYSADMIKSEGDTVKNLYEGELKKSDDEAFMDVALEAQFELDSVYAPGEYGILFRVKDELSGKTAVSTARFKLSAE